MPGSFEGGGGGGVCVLPATVFLANALLTYFDAIVAAMTTPSIMAMKPMIFISETFIRFWFFGVGVIPSYYKLASIPR